VQAEVGERPRRVQTEAWRLQVVAGNKVCVSAGRQ